MRLAFALPLLAGLLLGPVAAGDEPAPAASARPMLWRSEGSPEIWVCGTLDVPDPRAQALSRRVTRALDECDMFYTELPRGDADLARLEAQAKRVSALPPELGGLKKVLGEELYTRVSVLLTTPGGISTLESREPWYVRRLVVQSYLGTVCPEEPKLASHDLWDRARIEGLESAGLDTAPEFVETFDALTTDEQIAWLEASVTRLEKDKKAETKHHAKMVAAFLAGDERKVQALWRESLPSGKLGDKLARGLLDDRVRRMMGRFASRLKRDPEQIAFLCLDASLLAGEKGALKLLAAQGHKLKPVGR